MKHIAIKFLLVTILSSLVLAPFFIHAQPHAKYIVLTGQSNSVAVNGTTAAFNDSMMMTIGMHTIKNVMPFDSNYTHQYSRVKGAGWSSNNLMLGGVGALGIAIQRYYKDTMATKTYLVQGGFQGKDIRTFLSPANKYDASTQYGRTLLRCFGGGIQDSISTVIYYQYESDCGATLYPLYATRFDSLYRTWHRDLPNLQNIVYVSGRPILGAGREKQVEMRELQRTFSKIYPDVITVTCNGIKNMATDGIHFIEAGYTEMGKRIGAVLSNPALQTDVDSAVSRWPSDRKYTDGYVDIYFNYPVIEYRGDANDTVNLKDYIFFNNGATCTSLAYNGNILSAYYTASTIPTTVQYLPNAGYTGYGTGSEARYKGPWLRSSTGIDFPGFKIAVKP